MGGAAITVSLLMLFKQEHPTASGVWRLVGRLFGLVLFPVKSQAIFQEEVGSKAHRLSHCEDCSC